MVSHARGVGVDAAALGRLTAPQGVVSCIARGHGLGATKPVFVVAVRRVIGVAVGGREILGIVVVPAAPAQHVLLRPCRPG
jgi:hypothetical protein